jgi:hypothetical protein
VFLLICLFVICVSPYLLRSTPLLNLLNFATMSKTIVVNHRCRPATSLKILRLKYFLQSVASLLPTLEESINVRAARNILKFGKFCFSQSVLYYNLYFDQLHDKFLWEHVILQSLYYHPFQRFSRSVLYDKPYYDRLFKKMDNFTWIKICLICER